ncbi:MAG: DUF11 domain-containing protein [Planctomycetales bacterium]
MSRSSITQRVCLAWLCGMLIPAMLSAQAIPQRPQIPVWPQTPAPGVAGNWAAMLGKGGPAFQPVRVELPCAGQVSFYMRGGMIQAKDAPAQAGFMVGPLYRLKLSNLKDFPGAELYPSIELVDRLHPPAQLIAHAPVPVSFTTEEIEQALQGKLITKVVYLEQPNIADDTTLDRGRQELPMKRLDPQDHVLKKADELGRPLMIVRMGGRVPDAGDYQNGFFGMGAPIDFQLSAAPQGAKPTCQQKTPATATLTSMQVDASGNPLPKGITRTAHDARVPAIQCPPPGVPDCFAVGNTVDDPHALSRMYPDEYLFDGGDREHPLHYEQQNRAGLDTEDTLAEYKNQVGQRKTQKSNRVAIYAPRFGSVNNVLSLLEQSSVTGPVGATTLAVNDSLKQRAGVNVHRQRTSTDRLGTRLRASGVAGDTWETGVSQKQNPEVAAETDGLHESLGSQKAGQSRQREKAIQANSLQVSHLWSKMEFPVITARTLSLTEVYAKSKPAEVVGVSPLDKAGELKIEKSADLTFAKPGDVVTFKIEFVNSGDLPLKEVVILDNLTPRLELIPQSVKCDLPAQFKAVDNHEGSHVLEWALEDSLGKKQKGTITFQARIR